MKLEDKKIITPQDFWQCYEIDFTQSLDEKGLGSVYIGRNKEREQVLAVKSIEMHPMFDKGTVLARYRNAMELSHPNLLPYIAGHRFETEGTVQNFVLMPYIEGGNLQVLIPTLSYRQKIEIIDSVLDMLAYLHENGHIWQTLRSDHLLIKKVEDIIIPLGINYGAKTSLPQALFANYEYLAPEQLAEKETPDISIQTDIWSLGILIYEVFTGQLPFGKKSPQSTNRKIQERILQEDIPGLIETLPATYRYIVERCLQRKIENRWRDIAEIKAYLAEHPAKPLKKEKGILETLETMGENFSENIDNKSEKDKIPLFQRKFLRKPSRPITWLEVVLWFGLAILVGYLLSKLN